MWPQYVLLALIFMTLGMHLALDGEPRHPFSFLLQSVATCIELWLLYMGGFFKGML